ncbi:MAG: helix-turn-helix transcriptional regulator [Pseudomonadota bacterium]
MREGPDITRIAALIGDPARAAILQALMSGKALTAGELAIEAGVTPQTASGHLRMLSEAGLTAPRAQGRHRYYAIRDAEVAETLEALSGLAAAKGHLRTRTGPRDAELRAARVCYDHLAGARAVQIYDHLARSGYLLVDSDAMTLSVDGAAFLTDLGVDTARPPTSRRPLCRACLDWSERRSHLGGALGAAILTRFLEAGWARRAEASRHVRFTPAGTRVLDAAFTG